MDGRPLAISDLRPGDEIVVSVPAGSTVAVTTGAVAALPRDAVVLNGQEIYVVRRPQAP